MDNRPSIGHVWVIIQDNRPLIFNIWIIVHQFVVAKMCQLSIITADVTQNEPLEPHISNFAKCGSLFEPHHWGGAGRGSDDVIENFKMVRLS